MNFEASAHDHFKSSFRVTRINASLTLLLASCLGSWCPRALATGYPPITINSHGFQVPADRSRMVYRFGDKGPPEVLTFWEKHGRNWRLHWDWKLQSPRLVVPLEPVLIAPPEILGVAPDLKALEDAVRSFLDEDADFFGVTSKGLGGPYIYPAASSWVLVFSQLTPGGIPVRGANVRVVVEPDGSLGWVSAFVLRKCPDPQGTLLSRAQAESSAILHGGTVSEASLQVGFPGGDPDQAIPIWVLWVMDQGGIDSQHIIGARSGETLARRRVVKYFERVVEGRSPPREDFFASPQSEDIVNSPLDGAVIRDLRDREIGVTDRGGVFDVDVPQDPATVLASLEHGIFDLQARVPRKKDNDYVMLFQIKPLDRDTSRENNLPPQDDRNGDGVPDLDFSSVDRGLPIFNKNTTGEEYVRKAWWLECYHHTRRMLEFATRTLDDFEMKNFLPILGLRVNPMWFDRVQMYERPLPGTPDIAHIFTSITMDASRPGSPLVVGNVVPTRLLHEVGHHVFFNMTNYGEIELHGIEEGIADVLSGLTDDDCSIYHEGSLTSHRPTPIGFCLGAQDAEEEGLRPDLGDGFWELRTALSGRSNVVGAILLMFLALNKVDTNDKNIFDLSDMILEEILRADQSLFGPGRQIPEEDPHTRQIIDSFRGKRFIDAPFVRGDANVDLQVNISDAVTTLNFLFAGVGAVHICKNSMDSDDNGNVDVSDAIRLLSYLFLGDRPLPAPFPVCGLDGEKPGEAGNLGCVDFTCPR